MIGRTTWTSASIGLVQLLTGIFLLIHAARKEHYVNLSKSRIHSYQQVTLNGLFEAFALEDLPTTVLGTLYMLQDPDFFVTDLFQKFSFSTSNNETGFLFHDPGRFVPRR